MTEPEWRNKVDVQFGKIDGQLESILNRLREVEKTVAIDEVHRSNLEKELRVLTESLGRFNNGISWLLRGIVGAVIIAAVNAFVKFN